MKVINKNSGIIYVNKGQNPRSLYEHQIEAQKKLNKIKGFRNFNQIYLR